jgi:hypothetical protein
MIAFLQILGLLPKMKNEGPLWQLQLPFHPLFQDLQEKESTQKKEL